MSTALPDVDFQHVRELGNALLAQIDAVRAQDPIFWSDSQRAWIVSGHAEVAEGFSGKLPFSNERMSKVGRFMPDPAERARRIPTVLRLYPLQLVGMDPPAQGRMRRLLMPAFSRTAVERTRIFARQAISAAFAQALPNTPVDFLPPIPNRPLWRVTSSTDAGLRLFAARIRGYSKVVVVDQVASRLALAREFGASDVVDTRADNLDSAFAAVGGVDVCIDTTGFGPVVAAAVRALKRRGTIVLLGGSPTRTAQIDIVSLIQGKQIRGEIFGDAIPRRDAALLLVYWIN